jgi:hypothetical protein
MKKRIEEKLKLGNTRFGNNALYKVMINRKSKTRDKVFFSFLKG